MILKHPDDKLGDILQTLRSSKGMTQVALAKILKVTHAHIAQIETQRKTPSLKVFLKLLEAFKPMPSKRVFELRDLYIRKKYKDIIKLDEGIFEIYREEVEKEAIKSGLVKHPFLKY